MKKNTKSTSKKVVAKVTPKKVTVKVSKPVTEIPVKKATVEKVAPKKAPKKRIIGLAKTDKSFMRQIGRMSFESFRTVTVSPNGLGTVKLLTFGEKPRKFSVSKSRFIKGGPYTLVSLREAFVNAGFIQAAINIH